MKTTSLYCSEPHWPSAHALDNPIQQPESMSHIQILLGLICNIILGLSIGRTSFLLDSIKLLVGWAMSVHLKPDAPDNTSHDDLQKQILLDLPTDPNATRRVLNIASPVNNLPAWRDADTLVEANPLRCPELMRLPYWDSFRTSVPADFIHCYWTSPIVPDFMHDPVEDLWRRWVLGEHRPRRMGSRTWNSRASSRRLGCINSRKRRHFGEARFPWVAPCSVRQGPAFGSDPH